MCRFSGVPDDADREAQPVAEAAIGPMARGARHGPFDDSRVSKKSGARARLRPPTAGARPDVARRRCGAQHADATPARAVDDSAATTIAAAAASSCASRAECRDAARAAARRFPRARRPGARVSLASVEAASAAAATADTSLAISSVTRALSASRCDTSQGDGRLLLDGGRNRRLALANLLNHAADAGDRRHRRLGVGLDRLDRREMSPVAPTSSRRASSPRRRRPRTRRRPRPPAPLRWRR